MLRRLTNVRWTGLMAVVLVVAMIGGCGSRVKTQRDALYARTQQQEARLADTRTALEQAEAARARLAAQNAELNEQLAAQPANPFGGIEGVEVEQGQGMVTVRVPGDVLFASGSAELQSGAEKTLREVAAVLQQQYAGRMIRVEGHTDTDPIRHSQWRDNLQLSVARAASVERFLEEQGVSSERMYSAGFGSSQPRETKTQSRRVEIVVIMRGSPRPGFTPAQSGGGAGAAGGEAGGGTGNGGGEAAAPSPSPAPQPVGNQQLAPRFRK